MVGSEDRLALFAVGAVVGADVGTLGRGSDGFGVEGDREGMAMFPVEEKEGEALTGLVGFFLRGMGDGFGRLKEREGDGCTGAVAGSFGVRGEELPMLGLKEKEAGWRGAMEGCFGVTGAVGGGFLKTEGEGFRIGFDNKHFAGFAASQDTWQTGVEGPDRDPNTLT
jgi:hypothetical protein